MKNLFWIGICAVLGYANCGFGFNREGSDEKITKRAHQALVLVREVSREYARNPTEELFQRYVQEAHNTIRVLEEESEVKMRRRRGYAVPPERAYLGDLEKKLSVAESLDECIKSGRLVSSPDAQKGFEYLASCGWQRVLIYNRFKEVGLDPTNCVPFCQRHLTEEELFHEWFTPIPPSLKPLRKVSCEIF